MSEKVVLKLYSKNIETFGVIHNFIFNNQPIQWIVELVWYFLESKNFFKQQFYYRLDWRSLFRVPNILYLLVAKTCSNRINPSSIVIDGINTASICTKQLCSTSLFKALWMALRTAGAFVNPKGIFSITQNAHQVSQRCFFLIESSATSTWLNPEAIRHYAI